MASNMKTPGVRTADMSQIRLLKRLQDWQQYQGQSPPVDDSSLVASILMDVQNLLNTIQGTALINETLGLSDVKKLFVSHGNLAHNVVQDEIRGNITRFEPRIGQFALDPDEKSPTGALRWQLTGEIPARDRTIAFLADITLTADGQITVTSRA